MKYEPKVLVRLAISSKDISEPYIHESKNAIHGDAYLDRCIKPKLISFIDKHHVNDEILFWPKYIIRTKFSTFRDQNLCRKLIIHPVYHKARPIEDFWGVLPELVYARNWEARTVKELKCRIETKVKGVETTVLQRTMESNSKNLCKMYTNGVLSVCH